MKHETRITDNELRHFCITNYGTDELDTCEKCPYLEECEDFCERHNYNTPLFG